MFCLHRDNPRINSWVWGLWADHLLISSNKETVKVNYGARYLSTAVTVTYRPGQEILHQ